MWPFGKKKQQPEYPAHMPPPPKGGWDTTLMALGSGIGIIAQPFLKINPVAAVALGEGSGFLLETARQKHAQEQEALRAWHMELVHHAADRLVEAALAKDVKDLTGKDRVRLALFVEWGLIGEQRARSLPREMQAEILLTELAIAVNQSGMTSVRVADKFAFPKLQHQDPASPESLKILLEDKLRMHEILRAQNGGASLPEKMQKRLFRGAADAAVNIMTKPKSVLRSATSLIVDFPALRQIYNIVAAKGAAPTADEYVDRMCSELQSSYEKGFITLRRAERRQLRQSGIPYESVLEKKPEGGLRHVVRPKKGSAPA